MTYLDSFLDFLGKYIESDLIRSDKERNNFLNLIDKLTFQKELIQLRKKELTSSDIKEAGIRLGKKSQSAFRKK